MIALFNAPALAWCGLAAPRRSSYRPAQGAAIADCSVRTPSWPCRSQPPTAAALEGRSLHGQHRIKRAFGNLGLAGLGASEMHAGANAQQIGVCAHGARGQRRHIGLGAEIIAQIFRTQEGVARHGEFSARAIGRPLDRLVRRAACVGEFRGGIGPAQGSIGEQAAEGPAGLRARGGQEVLLEGSCAETSGFDARGEDIRLRAAEENAGV